MMPISFGITSRAPKACPVFSKIKKIFFVVTYMEKKKVNTSNIEGHRVKAILTKRRGKRKASNDWTKAGPESNPEAQSHNII